MHLRLVVVAPHRRLHDMSLMMGKSIFLLTSIINILLRAVIIVDDMVAIIVAREQ